MAFAVLLLALIVTQTTAALPGFYQAQDRNIPEAIREAANAVVQIAVLSVDPIAEIDIEKYERENNRTTEEMIRAGELNPMIQQLHLERLKSCRRLKAKTCALYRTVGKGSGFFLGDQKSLWTDYHVIDAIAAGIAQNFNREKGYRLEPWMVELSLGDQNLPIAIFDANGRLLFMSGTQGSSAHLDERPFDFAGLPFFGISDNAVRASSDFVRIQLSANVGRPLPLATSLPSEGSAVYAIGFPTGTGPYKSPGTDPRYEDELISRAPFPNSQGVGQHVSQGVLLSTLDGLNRILTKRGQPPLSTQDWDRLQLRQLFTISPRGNEIDYSQIIMSEIDVVFGNSGGPLLNASGEVIGMAQSIEVELSGGRYWRTTLKSTNLIEVHRKLRERNGRN